MKTPRILAVAFSALIAIVAVSLWQSRRAATESVAVLPTLKQTPSESPASGAQGTAAASIPSPVSPIIQDRQSRYWALSSRDPVAVREAIAQARQDIVWRKE